MSKTRKDALRVFGLLALAGWAGLADGCGSGHHAGNGPGDAPGDLFGTWRLVGTSGGITGQGYPLPDEPVFVIFNDDGTWAQYGGGAAATQKKYTVTRRQSGGNTFVSVIEYNDGSVAEIIGPVDGTTLSLSEDVSDGYTRQYNRVVYAV